MRTDPWSKEDEGYLRWAYSLGLALEWAAKHLDRTVDAVKKKASRLSLQHPRYGPGSGEGDLAAAIADHLGTEPPYERKGIRVGAQDLPALVRGYAGFNRRVLKMDHPPYQLGAIEAVLTQPLVCVVKGRQIGFSAFILAPAVVYRLFTHPHSLILIVSPTQRQSTLDLQTIRQLIAGNDVLRPSLVDVSQERVKLSNGSEVISLPSGPDGATIRGYSHVGMALVDEAAYVPDVVIESVLIPMLATSNGSLVLGGTPWGVGSFFHRAAHDEAYEVLHLPTMLSPHISPEWLEARRLEMDGLAYRTEFEAEFVAAADAYFDRGLIDRACKDYDYRSLPREAADLTHYVGVDWGRRIDASVVAVLERDDSADPPPPHAGPSQGLRPDALRPSDGLRGPRDGGVPGPEGPGRRRGGGDSDRSPEAGGHPHRTVLLHPRQQGGPLLQAEGATRAGPPDDSAG